MKSSRNGLLGREKLRTETRCWSNALTALMIIAIVSGCDEQHLIEQDKIAIETEEESLYAYTPSLWSPGEEITTCWTVSGFASEKAIVEDIITKTWQAYANVTFTGWGLCGSGGAELEITPGSLMRTWMRDGDGAEMELDFTASPQTTWARCVDNSLNRDDCIRTVSIHEFGHALAFAHEHNRPDSSCTIADQGTCQGGSDPNCVEITEDPDGNSIMNYCGGATNLSIGDIYGVIVVYGMDPALLMSAIS